MKKLDNMLDLCEKKHKWCEIKVIFIVFISICIMYYLNLLTPLYADDFAYRFSFADKGLKIHNLESLIQSQKMHYITMNGRSVTHTLAQFFLMIGKTRFNFINAIAFGVLIFVMAYHIKGNLNKIVWTDIFFNFIALWYMVPKFGESFLWLTGACNYLWGILIILIYLIPYTHYLNNEKNNKIYEWMLCFLTFFFAVIAGWTNENTSLALLTIQLVVVLLNLKKIRVWMLSGILGNILGGMLILRSPGQMSRLNESGGSLISIKLWFNNIFNITNGIAVNLLPLI